MDTLEIGFVFRPDKLPFLSNAIWPHDLGVHKLASFRAFFEGASRLRGDPKHIGFAACAKPLR